jgi:acetyl-CoA acetyltransferase
MRVNVVGIGMTPQGRSPYGPGELISQAATAALRDAGVDPERVSLILVSNALGGLLNDQECIRGQAWLLGAGLGSTHVVNIDNGCAGGSAALHLGYLAALAGSGPVLIAGVEKMWTGDRGATLNGIENCLTAEERPRLRADVAGNSGSVFMGMNAKWAMHQLTERGHTIEQFAATVVKSRRHGALNPLAQRRELVTAEEVLASPTVQEPLTRLMCSSFTDGAAAIVLDTDVPGTPAIRASVARSGDTSSDYHSRLAEVAKVAYDAAGLGPGDIDVVELHDAATSEELYALECLGFYDEGEAGVATLGGETTFGGTIVVNPSGGLMSRGHPIGATGVAQVVEIVTQLRGAAGDRQVVGARRGMTVNTGGIIEGDVGAVVAHVFERG